MTIREARESELAACRMILPDAPPTPARAFLLASSGPAIVGAATGVRTPAAVEGVLVSVVPPFRRRGIGSALLAAIAERAPGATHIAGWVETLGRPEAPAFAKARGFRRTNRLTSYSCDCRPFQEYHWKLRDKLAARARVPEDARILRVDAADREALARLWAQHIASDPHPRLDVIEHRLASGAYAASPVLVRDGELAGFMLARMEGRTCFLDAKVVAPAYRAGWAGVLLGAALSDLAVECGCERTEFSWTERAPDTASVAARFPGRITSVLERYEKPA
jgi:GNAT superfamily N-acetyltransferase